MSQEPNAFATGIAGAANAAVEDFRRHAAKPPYQKGVARASFGAFLLGLPGYLVAAAGRDVATLPPAMLLGLAAVAGFGLLLLFAGLRTARGPRDVMMAFWALALPAGLGWAMMRWFPERWFDPFGRAFCVALLCAFAVRFWIAVRGVPGNARPLVQRDIDDHEWKW